MNKAISNHKQNWQASWLGSDQVISNESSPYFRREFILEKELKEAVIYICGLGYYELEINGKKIGDHVLDPAQTDYEKRIFYVRYDITKHLSEKENCLGVILGNGWFNQLKAWNSGTRKIPNISYGSPTLLLQLEITYQDDSTTILTSDDTWKTSFGPIKENSVYQGEVYDAREELGNWSKPGFDDSTWARAKLAEAPLGKLVPQELPAIKKMSELAPVKITSPVSGIYVFDMGQNFAGWTKLRIKAEKGTKIQLRFAETVFADGMINTASTGVFATLTEQIDTYICKGGETEEWEPRFTYHGFRYVEMQGFNGTPTPATLSGIVVHSAVEKTGSFECSDDLLNRIHKTAVWTEISNLHGVPTDCPARERCGWLGDTHVSAEMSIYNFDMALFWKKYIRDILTSTNNGLPTMIAPGKRGKDTASVDWGTAIVQLPWYLYLYYGDTQILEECYSVMKQWLSHLNELAGDDFIIDPGDEENSIYGLGDWCPPGSVKPLETPVPVTSTAYYYFDAMIMSQTAEILNKKKDVKVFDSLVSNIKTAFNKQFLNQETVTYGSQTADSFCLYLGLPPKGLECKVAESLNQNVKEKHNGHFSTGIVGSRYLYWALSEFGYAETALEVMKQDSYPSFTHLFECGATTLWECWPCPDFEEFEKIHDPRSLNHPMQGGFDAWFYDSVAGIRPNPDFPGFKKIIFKSTLIGLLKSAKATLETQYGEIHSHWRVEKNSFTWDISVPLNTEADVYIPTKFKNIEINGIPILKSKGVAFSHTDEEFSVFSMMSGNYQITCEQ